MQIRIEATETWKAAYPHAAIGLLAMRGVSNPKQHAELDEQKDALEAELRARYAEHDRAALKSLPVIRAYNDYYKRFGKTYHVQLQLESIVHKGKSIPRVAALIEAMFMAELNNQLLTAGHDLDRLEMPVRIDVATGEERYVRINEQEQLLKRNDMVIADAQGVLSSIIYGPDHRTRITAGTTSALFTVYAPSGIDPEAVRSHLREIQAYAATVSPSAEGILLEVISAQ